MRVLLNSAGSTGDINPVIALGRALSEAGHTVRLAAAPLFQDEIERAELEYIYIPPDWDQDIFASYMLKLVRTRHPLKQLEIIYRSGMPFLDETLERLKIALKDADLFICSYLFPHFKVTADRYNVPFSVVCFSHLIVPSPDYPPHGIPSLRIFPKKLQQFWNTTLWKISNALISRMLNKILATRIKEGKTPSIKQFIFAPADLALVAVSKNLLPTNARINPRYQFIGHLRWQSAQDPQLEKELQDFCAGNEVPVITFGSVTFDDREKKMHRFLSRWPKNKKIIIQRGWAKLSPEEDLPNIKCIDHVSHDQLFRHASVVIHHGGAGTTASVWHSGKPGIIIPHIADQFLWAKETSRMEVGLKISKRQWPELLTEYVVRVENDQKLRQNAEYFARELAREDAGKEAVKLLEDFVNNYKGRDNFRFSIAE